MTRINVGIDPAELCDQHLIAEYRELPRCFARVIPNPPPAFKLGTGHVTWCSQYQLSLSLRFYVLVTELLRRDFNANFVSPPRTLNNQQWTAEDEEHARPIVQERILQRLHTMKRPPRWTNRIAPKWVDVLTISEI